MGLVSDNSVNRETILCAANLLDLTQIRSREIQPMAVKATPIMVGKESLGQATACRHHGQKGKTPIEPSALTTFVLPNPVIRWPNKESPKGPKLF